jgi:hypothetical protein
MIEQAEILDDKIKDWICKEEWEKSFWATWIKLFVLAPQGCFQVVTDNGTNSIRLIHQKNLSSTMESVSEVHNVGIS